MLVRSSEPIRAKKRRTLKNHEKHRRVASKRRFGVCSHNSKISKKHSEFVSRASRATNYFRKRPFGLKRSPELSLGRLGRPPEAVPGFSWALVGHSWGALGALLGRSWGALGRSWGALGRSWSTVGRSRTPSGILLSPPGRS